MPKVTIYVPDDLWLEVKDKDISASPVCQRALRDELERVRLKTETEMEKLEVDMVNANGVHFTQSFVGRWLMFPDPEATRSSEGDAGAFYGVALTRRGQFAVWCGHVNKRWDPQFTVASSIRAAVADGVLPQDIAAMASTELGEEVLLDI